MPQQDIGLQVNPADEIIRLGPLEVRFLLTGENSGGTIAVFEVVVPGAQRLAAPAHSHNHFEETIYGIEGVLPGPWTAGRLTWVLDRRSAFRGEPCTVLITIPPGTRRWCAW